MGDIGATQGRLLAGFCWICRTRSAVLVAAIRSLISASAGIACRQAPLRAANRLAKHSGHSAVPNGCGAALRRLPSCVRLPSLADGAPEALFPGGFSMTSGANGPAGAGGCPASAAGAAYRRSSLFFKTSSRGVASPRKALRGCSKEECPSSRNSVALCSSRSRSMYEEQSRAVVASERQSICRHPRGPDLRAARRQKDQPRRRRRTGDRPSEISGCQ